jgi:hypothetical protein
MRITERQIRKIVREMALKSYNIVTDDDPVGDEPFVIGNVIDKGLYDEEWPDQATSTLSYTRQLDPVEREKGRDYVAGTYGQKGYRRTVERQYARVPFPVNIFVLPPGARDKQYRSIVGLTGLRERGPDPRMMGGDMQGRLMELIRVLSPDEAAQISPEDMTLIIVPGNNKRYPGFWRTYDGAYMAIHALFEYDGPFSDELHGVKKIYKAFDMFNQARILPRGRSRGESTRSRDHGAGQRDPAAPLRSRERDDPACLLLRPGKDSHRNTIDRSCEARERDADTRRRAAARCETRDSCRGALGALRQESHRLDLSGARRPREP